MRLSFGETPVGARGRSKINVPNPLWGSCSAFFFLTRIEYRTDLFSVSFGIIRGPGFGGSAAVLSGCSVVLLVEFPRLWRSGEVSWRQIRETD
jgi:hypothetical protein